MNYLTSSTRQKIYQLVNKINNNKTVSLSERIMLNKYLTRIPSLTSLLQNDSIKFS